jgi:hypothetical protein
VENILDDITIERLVPLVGENQNLDSDISTNSSSKESEDDPVLDQT